MALTRTEQKQADRTLYAALEGPAGGITVLIRCRTHLANEDSAVIRTAQAVSLGLHITGCEVCPATSLAVKS